jgi:RHS repeat-associated protein
VKLSTRFHWKKSDSRRRNRRPALARATQFVVEALESRVLLTTNSWKSAVSGDWDTASNWSLGHVPLATENVVINLAGTYTVTHSVNDADSVNSLTSTEPITFSAGSLNVATTLTVNNTFTLSGTASLSVTQGEYVGDSGTGTFIQTGGQNSSPNLYLGYSAGDSGSYSLSGTGTLTISGTEYVGYNGTGNLNQTGGANTDGSSLDVGSSGTYILSNGSLFVGNLVVSNPGQFNWTGGTFSITNSNLTIGSDGPLGTAVTIGGSQILNLSGASDALSITSTGTLNLSGGTVNTTNLSNSGRFNWTSGTLNLTNSNLTIGSGGPLGSSLTLNSGQSLGITGSSSTLSIANTGTLSLSGGSLSVSGNEYVGDSGTGNFNQTGGQNTCSNLYLGYFAGDSGSYSLSGTATLSVSGNEYVGYNGTGNFNQSGGTNTISVNNSPYTALYLGDNSGSTGTYNLTGGGNLNANGFDLNDVSEYVGYSGTGIFNQSGGTNTIPDFSNLALAYNSNSTGTYALSGTGSLSVSGIEYVGYGSTGNFNQSGGTNTINSGESLTIGNIQGSTGTYTLSAGSLSVSGNEYVGNNSGSTGDFNQTGGTNTTGPTYSILVGNGSGSIGTYALSGNGSLSVNGEEFVGNYGTGIFNQTGGTNTVTGSQAPPASNIAASLFLGYSIGSTGTYVLSGTGALLIPDDTGEVIGLNGTGNFNQTAGTNSMTGANGSVRVGNDPGSTGTYSLSGTGIVSASFESIGYQSAGSFNQPGGTNTVSVGLYIGDHVAGASGTYLLSGTGTLMVASEHIGQVGIGTFNQTGGTNTVYSSGELDVGTDTGSVGTYTFSGGTFTVSGNAYIGGSSKNNVGGTGTLAVSDTGQMTVAGTFTMYYGDVSATNDYVGGGPTSNASIVVGGSFIQAGGTLENATVVAGTGDQGVTVTGGTLDAVTLSTNVAVNIPAGGTVNVVGGLTDNGTITVNSNQNNISTILDFNGGTLSGSGTVSLNDSGGYAQLNGTLTLAAGSTIQGFGQINAALANNGTVNANVSGNVLSIQNAGTATGVVEATNGGTLNVPSSLALNSQGILSSSSTSTVQFGGSFLGNTTTTALSNPQGTTVFDGSGTAAAPQVLEAMSDDMSNVAAGFVNNFVYGELTLANNTYVKLVNQSNNSGGSGADAVYAQSVVVPAGCTLNLNGLHLYARAWQVSGTILNGSINQLPSAGALTLATPTPGDIATAGQLDEWTFFDYGGQTVNVIVNPGSSGSPAPVSPQLQWANVQLVESNGTVLATAANTSAGGIISLSNVVLPGDGTYEILVNAPTGHIASTGNYLVSAYDVTPNVQSLNINQASSGDISTPFASDEWNFSATAGQLIQFNLIATSSSGLTFTLTGPSGYTAFSNLSISSSVITLPASGNYTLTVVGLNGATGSYSFEINQTAVTALSLATKYNGTWSGTGQSQLFSILVATTNPLSIILTDPNTADETELYASFGAPPTRQTYDYGANGSGSSQSLLIPKANAGIWYVLVYAESVASAPCSYTLESYASSVVVQAVTPVQYGANSNATLTLTGAGFTTGSSVALVASNNTTYSASNVTFDTFTQLAATFNLTGVPQGTYSIRVTNSGGGSGTLSAAFTVTAAGQANLQTKLILPSVMGYHIASTLYVEYSNTGTAAMPAPVLLVESSYSYEVPLLTLAANLQVSGYWTSSVPQGYSNVAQILASGKTPGLLEPGESVTVPIYYAGMQQPYTYISNFQFDLKVFTSTDTDPVNWNSLQSSLQPTGISNAAWNTIYGNLTSQLGNTWGGYVQMLDNEASYLGQLGEDVTDVSQLWGFAVQQADNALNPIGPYLASATDDSLATPGSLSLDFSRVFASDIVGRDTMGPLGVGWSTPWQSTASIASDGTVTITEPAGAERVFQPDSRTAGVYFSSPGDSGTLTADGSGGYLLTDADGTETDYSSNGALSYMQDTDGNRITAGYTDGSLTSLTASSGQSIDIAYNSADLISSITDSDGRTTHYNYDSTNTYLTSVTSDTGQITTYAYNTASGSPAQNALTSITFPGNTHQYFAYDSEGRLDSTDQDGGAQPLSFGYSLGQVSVTDGVGDTTNLYYNEDGLITKSVDPLGNVTLGSYDANFNLTSITNAVGQSESYTYNSVGEVTSWTDFLGNTTSFNYSGALNELSSMTDANGNTTDYSYDSSGDLLSINYANDTSEQFTYNPEGDATSFVDANGQPTHYTYNSAGQITGATFSDGSQYTYTYDTFGNLLTATDSTGTTTFTYAPTTEYLTKVAYPNGTSLTFSYNAAGERIQMVDQTGFTTNYVYDSVGRLSELTNGNGNPIVAYTNNASGELTKKVNGNGTYTTYSYDADGNILQLINYTPSGTVNSSFYYTYNSLGLETSEATLQGLWTYSYDADGQLIQAVFASNNTATIPNQNLAYSYDAMGNRTVTVINGVTATYVTNNVNEYTSVGGTAYQYDANGNLLYDGTNTYTYNSLNEMTSAVGPSGTTTYTYNALGQLVSSTVNGQTTQYLIDPAGLGNVVGTYSGSGNLIADYTYGLGLTSQVTPGGTYYYDFDGVGSAADLTNSIGGMVDTYSYLPFGGNLNSTGSPANPFQFVGQFGVQSETGVLQLMGARYYQSIIGRFLSRDPMGLAGGDVDTYVYANDAPTIYIDPSGLSWLTWAKELAQEASGQVVDLLETVLDTINYGFEHNIIGPQDLVNPFLAFGSGVPMDGILGSGALQNPEFRRYEGLPPLANPPTITGSGNGSSNSAPTATTHDPNAMIGPAGFGSADFVQDAGAYPYTVDFENSPTASAPAQQVTVTDQLSSNLNWSTFQLTAIGWGDFNLMIPAGSQYYQTTVPMTYNGQTFDVDVEAGLNSATGLVTATFYSIDPLTDLPPSVLVGFLPPENGTGRGEGYISYTVAPKANLSTGTQITNVALVGFDGQPQIATDLVNDENPSQGINPAEEALVTIDAGPPTSAVTPLPVIEATNSFTVSWSGQDDPGGSGVASYTIYVSTDGGTFVPWLTNTTQTSATYNGVMGNYYSFFSVAMDNVGNIQPTPTAAQAQTSLGVIFTGKDSSNFSDPNNWSTGTVPTTGQAVYINSGNVVVSTGFNVASLTMNGGSLDWTGGTLSGNLFIGAGAALDVAGSGAMVISGLTLNNAGAIVQTSGATTIQSVIVNTGSVQIDGGTLEVIGNIGGDGSLALGTNSTQAFVQFAGGGGTSTLSSLTINSGSTLDVQNNSIFINYGNGADPISNIQSYLQIGFNGGGWNGTGISSSTVAAVNASEDRIVYGIGSADGADGIISSPSSGQIEIMPTLSGDVRLQGTVNFGDFQLLSQYFGHSGGWDEGNFTYNSTVDFGDFQLLSQNFGQSASLSAAAGDSAPQFGQFTANSQNSSAGIQTSSPATAVAAAVANPVAASSDIESQPSGSDPAASILDGTFLAGTVNGLPTFSDLPLDLAGT